MGNLVWVLIFGGAFLAVFNWMMLLHSLSSNLEQQKKIMWAVFIWLTFGIGSTVYYFTDYKKTNGLKASPVATNTVLPTSNDPQASLQPQAVENNQPAAAQKPPSSASQPLSLTTKITYWMFGGSLALALLLVLSLVSMMNDGPEAAGAGMAAGLSLMMLVPIVIVLFVMTIFASIKSLRESKKMHVKRNRLSFVILCLSVAAIAIGIVLTVLYKHRQNVIDQKRCDEIASSQRYKDADGFFTTGRCSYLNKDNGS